MAQPQYKLSAPNTGSYQLAPQASPVSVFTRTKQLDPKFETDQAQIKAFQSFVKDIADWRGAENKDNREQAKLRALADDARGELDANLEAEDEDYQKYGRFLQGKNYSKEIGSRLVAEITVGSEGKLGLMDQAFADAKKPENANRKVEDIFSELLEDRKDYYRSQVPDSSDEFYSGFGEGFQPFANEINKAFFERVQKETYSDRRDNFSQAFRSDIEQAVTFLQDPNVPDLEKENFKKQNKFDHNYLRRFSEKYGDSAGLSGDAALGEAIRIWSSEIENLVLKADSEEELEVAQEMLAVFITNNENGIKLLDISVFQKEARSNYVSLTNAVNSKRDQIEAEEEKDKKEKRSKQEIQAIIGVLEDPTKNVDVEALRKIYPNLEPEDFTQLITLQQKLQDRGLKEKPSDPIVFGEAYIASKNGSLTRQKALKYLTVDKTINKKDFATLINNIETSTRISKPVRDYIEGRLVDVELERLPPLFRGQGGLANFEQLRPDDYRAFKKSLLELKLKIYDSTDKHLKDNNLELTTENQVKIMDKVLNDLKPDIEKHNKLVQRFNNEQIAETASKKPDEEIKPITIKISQDSSIDVSAEKQKRYFRGERSGLNLYNDYYDFTLSIRGAGMGLDKEDNIFASLEGTNEEKKKAGIKLFTKLQKILPKTNWPLDENGKLMKWSDWVKGAIKDDLYSQSINKSLKDAVMILRKDIGFDEEPVERPEPKKLSLLDKAQKYFSSQ